MSNRVQGYVWQVGFATQSQKLIALKLADHSNDSGDNVWPSKKSVAQAASCSETTVQLTLKVFRECGLLAVLEGGGKGPRSTTRYRLNVEMLRSLSEGETTLTGTANKLTVSTPKKGSESNPSKGSESDGIGIRWDRTGKAKGSESTKKGVGITDPEPSLKNLHLEPPVVVAAPPAPPPFDLSNLAERLIAACNGALDNPVNCQGLLSVAVPKMWLDQGCDLERDVLPTLEAIGKRMHGKRIRSWDYFTGPITEAKAKRERGLPTVRLSPPPPPKYGPVPFKSSKSARFDEDAEYEIRLALLAKLEAEHHG